MKTKSLVIFSGGLDSTVCLLNSLQNVEETEVIIFDYGQRHQVEIKQAILICKKLEVVYHVVDIRTLVQSISESALYTGSSQNISEQHKEVSRLPVAFVPGRNALFMSIAFSLANRLNCNNVIFGAAGGSLYPDCSIKFVKEIEQALNTGMETSINIVCPVIDKPKDQIFQYAYELGMLDFVIINTHTCYEGDRSILHDWGYGCGECPACKSRKQGYENFKSLK